jgi:hypothetical protein
MMTASTEDQLDAELFARGYLNGFRESLLAALHHHGFSLSASELLRIHGTDDKEVVHRWLDRAVTATSLEDVFPPAEVAASRRERPEHASDASVRQRSNALRSIIEACLAHAYACGCLCGIPGREEKQCTDVHVFHRPCTPDHETFDDVELLFELVDTSQPRDIDAVARDRIARGLRRVICIFVHEGEVREWSPATETWLVLDPAGMLIDPVLSVPIPIATLLEPTQEETVGALRLGTTRWLAITEEDEAEAAATRAEHRKWCTKWLNGCIGVIDELCAHHGASMSTKERARMNALDTHGLMHLFDDVLATRQIPAWLGRQPRSRSCNP